MPDPRESIVRQPPLVVDRGGSRYTDLRTGARVVVADLREHGRTWFRYHDYSSFVIHVSHHAARVFALTIGYSGREREHRTVVWEPEADLSDEVAGQFGMNAGHDVDTVADLLGYVSDALTDSWSRRPEVARA